VTLTRARHLFVRCVRCNAYRYPGPRFGLCRNPIVTVGGGVSANNTIGAPVITGDGINQAQTLLWSLNNGNADIDIAEARPSPSLTTCACSPACSPRRSEQRRRAVDRHRWPERIRARRQGRHRGLNDYVTAPATATIGNLPLLYAHKTAQISQDSSSPGIVDPGDVLR